MIHLSVTGKNELQNDSKSYYHTYTNSGDRPRPTPRPRPLRAESPMVGKKTSKILKVAAAESAKITISSTLRDFFGITILTTAMIKPMTKYLMTRLISSAKSNMVLI